MKKQDLIQFFRGNSSLKKKEEVERFIKDNNISKKELDKVFNEFWDENDDYSNQEVFSEVLFNEITSRIDQNSFDHSYGEKRTIRPFGVLKYAATIVLFFSLALYFLLDQFQPNTSKRSNIEMVLKQTSKGQKSTIMLSDGSKVILNSESQISYPKYFTDSTRTIQLQGEAYFEVAKDVTKPFSVIANDVKTTALGTSFNINGRKPEVKVSLATGKVVVQNELKEFQKENHHFLEPGEAIVIESKSNKSRLSKFDFKQDFLWKDGVLYFNNAGFEEIKNKLETWYDVEFDVENQRIEGKKFTGKFDNQTLTSVMESIGFALEYNYFLNGKKVKIIFNK